MAAEWLEPIKTTFPRWFVMSARRRRMNALMMISLSSASRAIRERRPSELNSRSSPPSVMRPSTRYRCPEILLSSPVNEPAPCVVTRRSPVRSGCTISMLPESTTKNGTSVSPGRNRISPGSTLLSLLPGRIRSICVVVKSGNICVSASSALSTGKEDIVFFKKQSELKSYE